MIELNKYKKDILQICTALSVQRLYLVGSAARDDFQPDTSDIDVLVDFMGTERLFAAMFWQAGRCDSEYGTEKSLCKEIN